MKSSARKTRSKELAALTDAERAAIYDMERGRLRIIKDEKIKAMVSVANEARKALEQKIKALENGLDSDIKRCEAKFAQEDEKARKNILFAQYEGKAGPFIKLPVEMISEILKLAVDDLDMSPWLLAAVCQLWMQTAFATPTLWRHILLDNDAPSYRYGDPDEVWIHDEVKHYSRGRWQVCWGAEQFNGILERTGAVPLNLSISIRTSGPVAVKSLFHDKILGSSLRDRIQSLDVNYCLPIEQELPFHKFKALRHLCFKSGSTAENRFSDAILPLCPNLEELELTRSLTENDIAFPFWQGLRSLAFSASGIQIHSFESIAPQMRCLRSLGVKISSWPRQDTPKISWPEMTTLALECSANHLEALDIPHLEVLDLVDNRSSTSSFQEGGGLVQFPFVNLVALTITSFDPTWLACLSLPRLTTMLVRGRYRNDINLPHPVSPSVAKGSFPELQTLTLEANWLEEKTITTLLCVPDARVVNLLPLGDGGGRCFGVLLLEWMIEEAGVDAVMCPNLTKLSIGSSSRSVSTLKKHGGTLPRKLATARRQAKRPLRLIEVYWPKGREGYH